MIKEPLAQEKPRYAPLTIAILWTAILAGTIITFIIAILLLNAFFYSPKTQVSLYLNALKSGEPDKALALLNASIPASSKSNALLTPEVLKNSSAKLENITLREGPTVNRSGKAHVDVHYTIGDKTFNTTFILENLGKQAIFFDNWNIVPAQLPTIEASIASRQSATIGGALVNLPNGQNTFAVFYPGAYEGQSNSKYLYSPPVNTVVSGNKDSRMTFDFRATDELSQAITEESSAFLHQCTEQKVLAPTGCPFSHLKSRDRVAGSTIRWSLVGTPTFALESQGDNWVVAVNGAARITADTTDLYTGQQNKLDAVEKFSYIALLRDTGDKVSVTPLDLN